MHRHERAIRRVFHAVWERRQFDVLDELVADPVLFHFRRAMRTLGRSDLIDIVERWHAAFPDLEMEVMDVVVDGDRAAARIVHRGAHLGHWKGRPPSGAATEVDEMYFFRFSDGRIAEVWEVTDEHALWRQIEGET